MSRKAKTDSPFPEIQHAKKRAFLTAYSHTASTVRAAEAAKCDRSSHHDWLKSDATYAAAFELAKVLSVECLEAEAARRAREGFDEGVWHQGVQVGTQRRYSDTLLIFLLKGAAPHKYRDNVRTELSGPEGKAIQVDSTLGAADAVLAALDRVAERLEEDST